ncbi:DUF362 domain-containing protein [bacterium]|nr:DUF362 domain-containing protein [bacterium]
MTRVSLIRCVDYDLDRVMTALAEALAPLGGIGAFVAPGERVLLKINMLRPAPPEAATTTHPAVAIGLARMVRDAGATPVIGDSCGGAKAYGLSATALEECGIAPLAREHGIETVVFETAGATRIDVPNARFLHEIYVSNAVLAADAIISVPKLKTHVETHITGAVKNMFGVLPGAYKLSLHRRAPGPIDLGNALLDIYGRMKPRLCVMDAILAMEGKGPSWGKPKHVGAVLASADGVALDHVASRLVGQDPMTVTTIAPAAQRGIGENDAAKIEIVGETIEALRPKDFKLTSNAVMRAAPKPLLNIMNNHFFHVRPRWNEPGCELAGDCERACPVDAITIANRRVAIDMKTCIDCMACYMVCPNDGIHLNKSIVARVLSA